MPNEVRYNVNINFICTKEKKNLCDLLCYNALEQNLQYLQGILECRNSFAVHNTLTVKTQAVPIT